LVGRRSTPKLPLIEHAVHARISKGSTPLVSSYELHVADWFDSSFDDQYVEPEWVAENVFRLKSAASRHRDGATPEDIVVVENNSGRAVRLLSIKAGDLFLVFDVGREARCS
jgi:hypothetical protein